jgi:hypothetical protein
MMFLDWGSELYLHPPGSFGANMGVGTLTGAGSTHRDATLSITESSIIYF